MHTTSDSWLPGPSPFQALPIERLRFRLRLRERARFRLQHGGVLHGLLCRVLGGHLPADIFPLALESGRTFYEAGSAYDFVVSAAGKSRALLPELERSLRSLALAPKAEKAATLEGNYELMEVEPLPLPNLEMTLARAAALARQPVVKLLLHAPLRLRLPPELAQPGSAYANRAVFPAALLLDRLWRRYRQLIDGEFPEGGLIPPLPAVSARVEQLLWLDMPVRGRTEGKAGRPTGTTLGGVCGQVLLENLPAEWLRLLVLMEPGHLGSATHFGFGAYAVEELSAWCRSARTREEALGEKAGDVRKAVSVLGPTVEALLDEGASYFRRGWSFFSAEEGLRRAQEEGFRLELAGELEARVARLPVERILAKAQALWPTEPLVERLRHWLGNPAEKKALERLLTWLFAPELAEELEREGKKLVRKGYDLVALDRPVMVTPEAGSLGVHPFS